MPCPVRSRARGPAAPPASRAAVGIPTRAGGVSPRDEAPPRRFGPRPRRRDPQRRQGARRPRQQRRRHDAPGAHADEGRPRTAVGQQLPRPVRPDDPAPADAAGGARRVSRRCRASPRRRRRSTSPTSSGRRSTPRGARTASRSSPTCSWACISPACRRSAAGGSFPPSRTPATRRPTCRAPAPPRSVPDARR